MSRFNLVVRGLGLWMSVDDEIQRVAFRVTRVVEAVDADRAAQQALELVGGDRRATPCPGALPAAHFAFGAMSAEDWYRWAYRHTDHHLRQFGV